jgi:hypothetical protein
MCISIVIVRHVHLDRDRACRCCPPQYVSIRHRYLLRSTVASRSVVIFDLNESCKGNAALWEKVSTYVMCACLLQCDGTPLPLSAVLAARTRAHVCEYVFYIVRMSVCLCAWVCRSLFPSQVSGVSQVPVVDKLKRAKADREKCIRGLEHAVEVFRVSVCAAMLSCQSRSHGSSSHPPQAPSISTQRVAHHVCVRVFVCQQRLAKQKEDEAAGVVRKKRGGVSATA